MKYRVHVFAIVRVPVEIEAESQQDAIAKAQNAYNWYEIFSNVSGLDTEYAEEFSHFLCG